mgnify:CR=1 FL=1
MTKAKRKLDQIVRQLERIDEALVTDSRQNYCHVCNQTHQNLLRMIDTICWNDGDELYANGQGRRHFYRYFSNLNKPKEIQNA